MTIEQTVEIPAGLASGGKRRLTIEVPREVPAGKARVVIHFPAPTGEQPLESHTTPHLDFLSGILAGAGDITLEQIREERLRKYL